jgi:hypothetical protein
MEDNKLERYPWTQTIDTGGTDGDVSMPTDKLAIGSPEWLKAMDEHYSMSLYDLEEHVRKAWNFTYEYGPYIYAVYYGWVCVKQGSDMYRVEYTHDEDSYEIAFAAMSEWTPVKQEIVPMKALTAVQQLSSDAVGGYGVVYGSPKQRDLYGHWFDSDSELRLDWFKQRPALYAHGLDAAVKREPIGVITSWTPDDTGVWIEGVLEQRNAYTDAVKELVARGALSWSSGSSPNLINVNPKTGYIKEWPITEWTGTPVPAEPRLTEIVALKSIYEGLGIDFSIPGHIVAEPEAEAGATETDQAALRQNHLKQAAGLLRLKE